jgi:methylated-DNA-protein-cysteine methyltransferase-like protein
MQKLGTARSARMVGWAMNASHEMMFPAPCGEQKRIAYWEFHFDGTQPMQQLLGSGVTERIKL